MPTAYVTFSLTATSPSQVTQPFTGFDKSVSRISCGETTNSHVLSIPNTTATEVVLIPEYLVKADLLVFVPSVQGTLSWDGAGAADDNCSVVIAANTPFILPNPHTATYSGTWASSAIATSASSSNQGNNVYFYQASGSAATLTIFGLGTGV